MSDLSIKELALAAVLSYAGFHPYGHISEGNKQGVQGRVDYKDMVERYNREQWNKLSDEEKAKIHAAGFDGQQMFANALYGKGMEKEAKIVNALYKLGYISGIKPKDTKGDPELLAESSKTSKGRINALLAASAAYDLMGGKDSSLDFRVLDGNAPGLVYTKRF